jgi:23S rRNA G2445 N2-methylase RlmL
MDHRRTEQLYAVVSPGLESICAAELSALEITPQEVTVGGITSPTSG